MRLLSRSRRGRDGQERGRRGGALKTRGVFWWAVARRGKLFERGPRAEVVFGDVQQHHVIASFYLRAAPPHHRSRQKGVYVPKKRPSFHLEIIPFVQLRLPIGTQVQ